MKKYTLKVDDAHVGLRLDIFLTQTLPETPSRSFLKGLILNREISVNAKIVKPHYRVASGDEVVVNVDPRGFSESIDPENIPLNVFYTDEDFLIVDKPNGLLVHPAKGQNTGTLVNALLYHYQNLSDVNGSFRPGIVHRLDRETSGLLIVARNNVAHVRLAREFERHRVHKRYIALVEGSVEFDEGVIDAPLARHLRHRDKKTVAFDDAAKPAKTFYRVLKRFSGTTQIALFPQTGRTHQLRVHMAYLGHPILGDDKYGHPKSFSRLALHAQSIGFKHPRTKRFIEFSQPSPLEFKIFTDKT